MARGRTSTAQPDARPAAATAISQPRSAALTASGKTEQNLFHLNRAMDNGLNREQAVEVITHLAFFAGCPNAMSALPVAKNVFTKHGEAGSGN